MARTAFPRSHGHTHRGAQSAERAVRQHDVAAVRAGDVAGDGEAEAGAAFVLVARVVAAEERLEHFVTQLGRNAGAVVVDRDGEVAVVAMPGDGDATGEA